MRSLYFTAAALTLATTAALAEADCPLATGDSTDIGHARLYIEDNVPDEDIGVHGLFDDHAWRVLCVYAPDGTEILSFEPSGPLGELGVAGLFFESNEPPYGELGLRGADSGLPRGRLCGAGSQQ